MIEKILIFVFSLFYTIICIRSFRKGNYSFIIKNLGLSCPEPVMLTQAALKSHGNDTVKVLVTEPHSKANVEKFARSQGKTVTVTETGDGFELIIQ